MPSSYLLDTDIFRLYVTGDPTTVAHIRERINSIYLSSITIEEMVVGRLNIINKARSGKTPISLVEAHEEFTELLADIRPFPTLAYSQESEQIFQTFSASVRRIGPQDCRLAAQAMAEGLIVVTRNQRDFKAIGSSCEDWSV